MIIITAKEIISLIIILFIICDVRKNHNKKEYKHYAFPKWEGEIK